MPLPTSRDVTLVADAEVPSSLLNNLQDCVVGLKHGEVTRQIPAASATPEQQAATPLLSGPGTNYWSNASGAFDLQVPLELVAGDRIKSVKARIRDTGSPVTMALYKVQLSDGAPTQVGSTQTSASSSSNQELSISALTEVVADGFAYYMRVALPGTGRFYGGRMTFDHP